MKTAASPINRGFFRWLCLGLLVLVAACNDDQGASGGNTPDPTPKVRHFTTMELTPASARMRATIGDTVTMVMALSDTQHAVAHFEVFINNVSRFTADSTASTTFSWSTTAARVGDQTIKVVATTPDGKTDNHYDRVILASDRVPEPFGYRIVKTYPHDPAAFTQGLLFENGHLFESIGLKGQSALKEVELETGKAVRQVPMESNLFAEGLAVVDNRLVQLTYQAGVGFVYDKSSFNRIGQFSYLGEGWGITYDSTHLIMSNGKHILQLLDPQSMSKVGELEVWNDQKR
ncbi:MAG: glutaminyl-peptide cyclotransferase, partial [Bacteroidota bacterium]